MTVARALAYSEDDEELSCSLSGLQAPLDEDDAASPGMRVLLVEDDFADTQLIQRALFRNPQVSDVVARNSPTLALVELSSGRIRPALIFLDIRMPGINGFQFLEEMRKISIMDETPVVFLTSSVLGNDVGRAMQSSARDYIVKPDTFEELESKLDLAIRRVGPV